MIYTLRSVLLFGDPLSGWTVGLHPLWQEVIQDWLLVAPGTVEIGVARSHNESMSYTYKFTYEDACLLLRCWV